MPSQRRATQVDPRLRDPPPAPPPRRPAPRSSAPSATLRTPGGRVNLCARSESDRRAAGLAPAVLVRRKPRGQPATATRNSAPASMTHGVFGRAGHCPNTCPEKRVIRQGRWAVRRLRSRIVQCRITPSEVVSAGLTGRLRAGYPAAMKPAIALMFIVVCPVAASDPSSDRRFELAANELTFVVTWPKAITEDGVPLKRGLVVDGGTFLINSPETPVIFWPRLVVVEISATRGTVTLKAESLKEARRVRRGWGPDNRLYASN